MPKRAKNGPVTVTYADGSVEVKSVSEFKRPKTRNGRCTRCGQKVEWRDFGSQGRRLVNAGTRRKLHPCYQQARLEPKNVYYAKSKQQSKAEIAKRRAAAGDPSDPFRSIRSS